MIKDKYVILGANGPIGSQVAVELQQQGKSIVKVGRSNKKEENYRIADAKVYEQVKDVCYDASHIYITIGLEYNYKIWQRDWPLIMENVIRVAKENHSKLIFFDNIYAYGPTLSRPITEDHSLNPPSKKGEVRLNLLKLLEEAKEDLEVLIVKAPDFFGPKAEKTSIFYIQFLENLLQGKDAVFIGTKDKSHSYGYVNDLARALIELSLSEESYQQVWHLPAYATNGIHDVVREMNSQLGTNLGIRLLPKGIHRILAWFNPLMKDTYEMRYQFDYDYDYNWDKFRNSYQNFELTPFNEAIKETIQSARN